MTPDEQESTPDTTQPLKAKEIRKGTGDVLKDLAYAQRFTEGLQDQFGGRLGLDIDFVDRALRVAMNEIKLLRGQLVARKKVETR